MRACANVPGIAILVSTHFVFVVFLLTDQPACASGTQNIRIRPPHSTVQRGARQTSNAQPDRLAESERQHTLARTSPAPYGPSQGRAMRGRPFAVSAYVILASHLVSHRLTCFMCN